MEDKVILTRKEYQELNDRVYLAESQLQEWENHIKDGTMTIKHSINIVFQSGVFAYVDAITSEPIESHEVNVELSKFGVHVTKHLNAAFNAIREQCDAEGKEGRIAILRKGAFWEKFLKLMGLKK